MWHLAIKYAGKVYEITELFPQTEIFGLTQQIRRAAVSVSLNIAEGAGRDSDKDFKRFLGIANSSIFEVVSGFAVALDRGYVTESSNQEIYSASEVLAKKINSFKSTLSN
ncbi:MAG: four helix bundle protein [Actinomycetota bacterium]|nr:four helix bundle protein [Actinomycetota bacterium]